jgi:hypothetical protein
MNVTEESCVWTDIGLIFLVLTPLQGDMLKMVKSTVSHSVGSRSVVYGGGVSLQHMKMYIVIFRRISESVSHCTLLFVIRARGL